MALPALVPIIAGLAGSLGGAALGKGDKPEIPEPRTVDPYATQLSTIRGNIKALPEVAALGREVNFINQRERNRMLRSIFPEMDRLQGLATSNYGRYLEGALTPAEEALIRRNVAGRALALGTGPDIQKSWELGSLLGTLSERQGAATAGYPSFMANLVAPRTTGEFNVTSQFPEYGQVLSALTGQAQAGTQRDWYQSQINAAPDPALSALGSSISGIGGMLARYGLESRPSGGSFQATPYLSYNNPYTANYVGAVSRGEVPNPWE